MYSCICTIKELCFCKSSLQQIFFFTQTKTKLFYQDEILYTINNDSNNTLIM